MRIVTVLFLMFSFLLTGFAFSQNAVLTGKVVKIENGQEVPVEFAKVLILKADSSVLRGTSTDFDGVFKIVGVPGKAIISVRQSGLIDNNIDVVLVAGENAPLNVTMEAPVLEIKGDFTVIGYRKAPNSVAGDDVRRKEASNATDGMTKEQMKATGDANAGDAVQRVPGVSVQAGKYVFVRGLGDRYTKTILNGVEIPGLDPDRNTVQLDIFPTALIENITVYKTFTPDLAGDFAGGLLDIITKDAPQTKEMQFNFGSGFNSVTTFNNQFLSYKGGVMDYFGIDDGSRALPIPPTALTPDPSKKDPLTYKYTKAFTPNMGLTQRLAMPNHTYGFSYGNQVKNIFKKEGREYGFVVAANYRNNNQFYEDMQYGIHWKSQEQTKTELEQVQAAAGIISENDVLWTAVANQTLKFNQKSKLSLGFFHTQNGVKTASTFRENNIEGNQAILIKQNLQYTQRRITNLDLKGAHTFSKMKMKWNLAPTLSNISDPDIRSTILEEINEVDTNGKSSVRYELNESVGAQIRRIFRNLDEKSLNAKVNFAYEFMVKDTMKSTLSFGAANLYKKRDFSVFDYNFDQHNTNAVSLDPNFYFQEENLWTPENDKGTYVKGQKELANQYSGSQMVSALYAMNELPFSAKLKATYGLRVEQAINRYTGSNNAGTTVYKNDLVLNELSYLPSMGMLYKIKGKKNSTTQTNFRGSISKTVARPSFREKSIAQIYDPIIGRTFNGNILLKQTDIYNVDFRWERFFGRTELISASVFYKKFYNPIEIATFDIAPTEVKPVNAGEAEVYGFELEIRKAIGFKAEEKAHMSFIIGNNFNYIFSRVDMTKVNVTKGDIIVSEYDNRVLNARGDEEVGRYRPMYGQSPFSINTFATFVNAEKGTTINASHNVQGRRLSVIGVGLISDVYELPFHSLNLKGSKTFGLDKKWMFSLVAQNLLNNSRREYFISHDSNKKLYYQYRPGIQVTCSIVYKL